MNTGRILTAVLSAQLFIATTSSSFSQTNHQATAVLKRDTIVSAVSDLGSARKQEALNGKADAGRDYLVQVRNQAAQSSAATDFATNDVPIYVGNLEWTGQYAERFVRIPEGNSGKPKLVRFLIPVYREKSTKPEASVGTGDKKEQDRWVAGSSLK